MSEHYYTPDELADMDKAKLEAIAEARGLEVTGTGAGGNVVLSDLEQAITENQDSTGINPALAPQPEPETEGTYKVSGPHEVHGHAPGETFTATIPSTQESLLVESGAVVRVETASPKSPKEGE